VGGRRGRRPLGVLRAGSFALVLGLALGACEHEQVRPSLKPASQPEVAALLLKIELDARLLRHRADDRTLQHYTARLDALDTLLAHIALTTRYLAEGRMHAAEVGTEIASISFDFMRADFEATIRHIGGTVRDSCNHGLAWTGIGIQGLARDPGWADRTQEVAQALGQARSHRDNVLRAAPIANVMRVGVAAASLTSTAASMWSLTRSGLAALARLATWMERGGASFGVLQVAPEGGAAIQLVTSAGALTLTHAEVMVLVNAGQISATAAALHMMASDQPPKVHQAKAFEEWAKKLPTKPTPTDGPRNKYEIAKTGPVNYQVKGAGDEPIWADGLRSSDGHLLEAKYIENPARSPFIDGSGCPGPIRTKALVDMVKEFKRYAAVIRDASNPVVGLEVIVNDARAVPYFESLLKQFSIPGQVIVSPL